MNQPDAGPAMAGVSYCPRCGGQLAGRAPRCGRCGALLGGGERRRSKVAAALLAFFLGGVGVHKFYLGRWGWGIVYLLFCWTGIPGLVALVEFIILLVTSEEDFQRKYPGPGPGAAMIVVVALLAVVMTVGILAAIAIPNFLRYQLRAKAAGTTGELVSLMNAEVAAANSGRGMVAFAPLPAAPPGTERRAPAAEERARLAQLDWQPQETYVQFRVALAGEGRELAASFCAETDLDGDGQHAATVGFLPLQDAAGAVLVAPPPAPCSDRAAIDPADRPFRPDRANKAMPVSPRDVF